MQAHDRCGIITARSIDPLSKLIDKITGLHEEEPNSVGFYYQVDSLNYIVILFNSYDNDRVSWLDHEATIDLLLASPFVNRVTFYPLITQQNSIGLLLSRETISKRYNNTPQELEKIFHAALTEVVRSNITYKKRNSYMHLLLKTATITGYNLVNRVLLRLMNIEQSSNITTGIIPCPLLKTPASIIIHRNKTIKQITDKQKHEIKELAEVCTELYLNHELFRDTILTRKTSRTTDINDLLVSEYRLITYIIQAIQDGCIVNTTLNSLINNLDRERHSLSSQRTLPVSTCSNKIIRVTEEEPICTFQQQNTLHPLEELRYYINTIIGSLDREDPTIVNLQTLVTIYNNLAQEAGFSKILKYDAPLSKQAAIITEEDISTESDYILITTCGTDLSRLSEEQLLDTLIYIDSLRSSDGTSSTKYVGLQNKITRELAHRRK